MNTISVITSQNIELEFELGSLGDRIIGRILDLLVQGAYVVAMLFVFGFGSSGGYSRPWLMLLFIGLPFLFYDLLSEILLNGQSLGKKVMGIKVISLDGQQASFRQYLTRWLFRIIDFSLSGNLVAVIMVAVSEKKQRLGDLVAGTVLVKTNTRTQISDTIYQAPHEDYQVMYPEVINLKDQDIQLIKEILKSVQRSGNTSPAFQAQQKVEEVLNIRNRHYDSTAFLNAVLADYNYLTSRL